MEEDDVVSMRFFAVGCTPFRDKERSMLIEIIDEDVRNKNASYSTVAETPTDCLYIDAILSRCT